MHANCHRADLAFKDALKEAHAFLDVLSDGLQQLAAWYNTSPSWLQKLAVSLAERPALRSCQSPINSQMTWSLVVLCYAVLHVYCNEICPLPMVRVDVM